MNKEQLIRQLHLIKARYVNQQPVHEEADNIIVNEYADCLNHPSIENHLLETGIVSNRETLPEIISFYQSAENILQMFSESYYLMEEMGLVRLKKLNKAK